MSSEGLRERYLRIVDERGLYASGANLEFYGGQLFHGVPLQGRSVLDIGGGTGVYSFLAAALGASRVVCLEPEAAGATSGVQARFQETHELLGSPDHVRLETRTLQELEGRPEAFDVLLLNDSVNHLDEDACIVLKEDAQARERFRRIFAGLYGLGSPGAHLIVTDCSRYNLFPLLRLRNPIARSIEWHKHQSPYFWAKLLKDAGFRDPHIGWTSFNRLGRPGRVLLGNAVASFLLTSHFRLVMHKPG